MAQAQHGSAPDIAAKNIANPTSLMLSLAMMLEWLGDQRGDMKLRAAGRIAEMAVDQVLDNSDYWTRDLGGSTGTAEFSGYVSEAICSIAQASAMKS